MNCIIKIVQLNFPSFFITLLIFKLQSIVKAFCNVKLPRPLTCIQAPQEFLPPGCLRPSTPPLYRMKNRGETLSERASLVFKVFFLFHSNM